MGTMILPILKDCTDLKVRFVVISRVRARTPTLRRTDSFQS